MEDQSLIIEEQKQKKDTLWLAKKKMFQAYKNESIIKNRIKILEMQKKKKIKTIQNMLEVHQRDMNCKIKQYKHQNQIKNKNELISLFTSNSAHQYRNLRLSRQKNLQSIKSVINLRKTSDWAEQKRNHSKLDSIIKQERNKHIEQNISKRNKVKLMQISNKQNLYNFWEKRIQNFRLNKNNQMLQKLQKSQQTLKKVKKIERDELSVLQELKKADQLQENILQTMKKQRKMKGQQLVKIYNCFL